MLSYYYVKLLMHHAFMYRKSIVLAIYSHIIMPTNGPQLWPTNVTHPVNPPIMRRSIVRLKKNFNKVSDELRTRNTLPRLFKLSSARNVGVLALTSKRVKGSELRRE